MKIAYLTLRYKPAPLTGSEVYIEALSEVLASRGHSVAVLTSVPIRFNAFYMMRALKSLHFRFYEKIGNIEVFRFPKHYELISFSKLLKWINKVSVKAPLLDDLLD